MPDLNGELQPKAFEQENSPIKDVVVKNETLISSSQDDAEPPLKRRKVAESGANLQQSPRTISPPWKRIAAEGPTSFVEDGRRKSGRTNFIPLELQPQSGRRQTRAAFDKVVETRQNHPKPSYKIPSRKIKKDDSQPREIQPEVVKRGPGRPPKRRPIEKAPLDQIEVLHNLQNSFSSYRKQSAASKYPLQKHQRPKTYRRRTCSSSKPVEEVHANGYSHSEVEESTESSDSSTSPPSEGPYTPLRLQKVTFRVRLPQPSIATPTNVPLAKKYNTFEDFLEQDENEPRTGQESMTTQQIRKEAILRQRVWEAQRPGSVLDKKTFQMLPDKQIEPKKQFGHHDHLIAHISHFRTLLRAERKDHKRKAELIAHEAKKYVEQKLRKNKIKTREEIEIDQQETTRQMYQRVVKTVDRLWMAVKIEVETMRQKEYEDEQQAEMKGHLARVLDRTDQMLSRQLEADESPMDTEDESDEMSEDGSGTDDSEQMSDTDSRSASEAAPDDPDAGMSIDELKKKYGDLPESTGLASPMATEIEIKSFIEASDVPTEEEDSDPETEMDSEFDTSDSDGDEDEDEDDVEEHDNDNEDQRGLWSLFSRKEIAHMTTESDEVHSDQSVDLDTAAKAGIALSLDASEISGRDSEIDISQEMSMDQPEIKTNDPSHASSAVQESLPSEQVGTLLLIPENRKTSVDTISQEPSTQISPHTSATKPSEADSVSSIEPQGESPDPPSINESKTSKLKTRVPSLLRGTLREYQHEGLDWLAELYAAGRSGILADEMGLGKTIQSIALLAHLAEVYEVWGPHLIVVPTSVMLNWEMEFKKFLPGFKILTYYGTLEERKQKRRGWMADDSFNVCITSYQLVLQDANSFKRRRWHYMILDEAHNIKNFRSERWQTMMTFNTRARLLLTGTPLQNNLTELWSLLFFLHYGQENEGEDDAFAGLKEWSEWFKRPVESILEHGTQILDKEDQEQIAKLHKVIRPFLLRRLKADVEKQMPLKYEHVELCRLSKRQRQLYDGFMSRAQTKETLASGNYLSIINALMQLRKVCNHPDLFETRPINTSLALPRSVAAEYEIRDLFIRRRMLVDESKQLDLDFLQLAPISCENISMIEVIETTKRHAYHQLKGLRDRQWLRMDHNFTWHGEERRGVLSSLENVGKSARLQELDRTMYFEAYRHHQHPVYGRSLLAKLSLGTTYEKLSRLSNLKVMTRSWESEHPISSMSLIHSIQSRARQMEPLVQKYACITPAVIATDLGPTTVTDIGVSGIREMQADWPTDPFHEARMKLTIAFPDKRLLQYDCGKLQRLDKLLRRLQTGGHRALIFTQMTKVLDVLEQFLNIHGYRYLRLDGATKVEQRQILTERFNNDNRIPVFILSSRSGGLGINLTGADTVIFYDLDWNPAMDKQCTDRAHRIGQTRDVHIYRFVSEHTIESNILRKANQKQLLDDVVIQEGDFTTDYTKKLTYRDMLDDDGEDDAAGMAMNRVLGNEKGGVAAFEHAEDQEDIAAAKVAAREVQHADDGDFEDKAITTPHTNEANTPGPFAATNAALAEEATGTYHATGISHIDDYLVKIQLYFLRDVPLGPKQDRRKRGRKKKDEHRVRRQR